MLFVDVCFSFWWCTIDCDTVLLILHLFWFCYIFLAVVLAFVVVIAVVNFVCFLFLVFAFAFVPVICILFSELNKAVGALSACPWRDAGLMLTSGN
jgi:hypothetical protein